MTNIIDKVKVLGAIFIVVAGVAAFYALDGSSQLLRVGLLIVSIIAAVGVALLSTPGQDAWDFAKGARGEIRKVVWPTRRDTVQSTLIVIVMVILIGLFLWLLDIISFWLIYDLFLQIGNR